MAVRAQPYPRITDNRGRGRADHAIPRPLEVGLTDPILIFQMRDQIIHNARIRQRRDIAQIARIALGDLAQDAAHDLA